MILGFRKGDSEIIPILSSELNQSVLIIIIIMHSFQCHSCAIAPCRDHFHANFFTVSGYCLGVEGTHLQALAPTVVANSLDMHGPSPNSVAANLTTLQPVPFEPRIVQVSGAKTTENQESVAASEEPSTSAVVKHTGTTGRKVFDYHHRVQKLPRELEDDDLPSSWSSMTANVGSPNINERTTQDVDENSPPEYHFEKIEPAGVTPPKKKTAPRRKRAAAKPKRKGRRGAKTGKGSPETEEWLRQFLDSPKRNPVRKARMKPNYKYIDEIGGYMFETPKRSPVTQPPKKSKKFRESRTTPSPPKLSPAEKGIYLFKEETPDSPELDADRGPASQDPLLMDGQEYILRKILAK